MLNRRAVDPDANSGVYQLSDAERVYCGVLKQATAAVASAATTKEAGNWLTSLIRGIARADAGMMGAGELVGGGVRKGLQWIGSTRPVSAATGAAARTAKGFGGRAGELAAGAVEGTVRGIGDAGLPALIPIGTAAHLYSRTGELGHLGRAAVPRVQPPLGSVRG